MTSYRTPPLRVIGHALWIGTALALAGIPVLCMWRTRDYGYFSVALIFQRSIDLAMAHLPATAAVCVLVGALTALAMNTPGRLRRAALLAGGFGLAMAIINGLVRLAYYGTIWSSWLAPALAAWVGMTAAGAAGMAWRQRTQDLRIPLAGRRFAWRMMVAGLSIVGIQQGWQYLDYRGAFDAPTEPPVAYESPRTYDPLPAPGIPPIDEEPEPYQFPPDEYSGPLDPAVSLAAAREDIWALYDSTLRATSPDLLWVEPLSVLEETCTNSSGVEGVRVTLTGHFSTHDLDAPGGNVDSWQVVQENQDMAKRIAEAWIADDLLIGRGVMREDYILGDRGRATIDDAEVGLANGTGNIRVLGECAMYA